MGSLMSSKLDQSSVFADAVLYVFSSFNSLAPGRFEWNFMYVIFKWILVIDGLGISWGIALILMSLDYL